MRRIGNGRKQSGLNQGITLIALVITIIVLLILAGISIATLTGENGLLTKAENAKEETRGASVEEARNLWKTNQKADNYSESGKAQTLEKLIDDLVEQKLLTEDERDKILGNDTKGIKATGEVTIGSRTIVFKDYIEVGDYVDYNPTVIDKKGTPVDAEGIPENERKLIYKSPKGTGMTHGNGNSEQKFTATKNTRWRVLSIENGTVELISEDVIKTDDGENFILEGAIGYLYAEQELNEVCKIFGYGYGADSTKGGTYTTGGPKDTPTTRTIEGTGARSITIDDINKKAGITEADYTTLNSSYGDTTNPPSNAYYPTITTSDGSSSSPGIKNLKYTQYSYDKSKIENSTIQEMIFNGFYWLASRSFITTATGSIFNVRSIGEVGVHRDRLCSGNGTSLTPVEVRTRGILPIVTLKSDIIDISANYDSENGWRLK